MISLDSHYSDKLEGDPGLEKFSLGRLMNTGVYFARARIQGATATRLLAYATHCVLPPSIATVLESVNSSTERVAPTISPALSVKPGRSLNFFAPITVTG